MCGALRGPRGTRLDPARLKTQKGFALSLVIYPAAALRPFRRPAPH